MIWNGLKDTKEETGLKHGEKDITTQCLWQRKQARMALQERRSVYLEQGKAQNKGGLCLMSVRGKSKK